MTANHFSYRQPWWMLGIVLVVAFLGHDLLMATTAQATAHESSSTHHAVAATADPSPNHSHPTHPDDCGISRPVIARTIDRPDAADDVALAGGALWAALPSPRPAALNWETPTLPSGVRRVLLQVFRL